MITESLDILTMMNVLSHPRYTLDNIINLYQGRERLEELRGDYLPITLVLEADNVPRYLIIVFRIRSMRGMDSAHHHLFREIINKQSPFARLVSGSGSSHHLLCLQLDPPSVKIHAFQPYRVAVWGGGSSSSVGRCCGDFATTSPAAAPACDCITH